MPKAGLVTGVAQSLALMGSYVVGLPNPDRGGWRIGQVGHGSQNDMAHLSVTVAVRYRIKG